MEISVLPPEVPADGSGELQVLLDVPDNVRITSLDWGFFFIKTDTVEGISWGEPIFPAGIEYEGETVYQGKVTLKVPFSLSSVIPPGNMINITGNVGYQACTEIDPIYCTPPVERQFTASLAVIEGGADGSVGEKGLVTSHSIFGGDKLSFDQVYTCGPDPMMKAVARIAKANDIPCEVSLENTMACGMGACLCCVVETPDGYVCVCTEGPVFDPNKLKWQT